DKTSSVVEVAPSRSTIFFLLMSANSRFVVRAIDDPTSHYTETENISECLDNRRLSPVTCFLNARRRPEPARRTSNPVSHVSCAVPACGYPHKQVRAPSNRP